MDLTIVRDGDKTSPYRVSNIIRILFKWATFGYTIWLCLKSWSLVAVLYICLLFYWVFHLGSGMARLHKELLHREKGASYTSLLRLSFSNPEIRFFYKLLYMVLGIFLVKIVGSFLCSMNYIRLSADPDFREQLMRDLQVSTEQNTFTFYTLLKNVLDELFLLSMLMGILFLEPAVTPFTKESIDHFIRNYGEKVEFSLSLLQCLCLFIIPLIAKSPLTMVPLLGLVLAFIFIFYYNKPWASMLYLPEIFLGISLISFMFFRTQVVGLYWLKTLGTFFCDYSLPPSVDFWNTAYIGLGIFTMFLFRLHRWVVYVQDIAQLKATEEDRLKDGLYLPPEPSKIEVIEAISDDSNHVTTPRDNSDDDIMSVKRPFSRVVTIPPMVDKEAETTDLFSDYFCRNFDSIIKVNRTDALNIHRKISDPLILELSDYINIERLEEKWSAGKIISVKEKSFLYFKKVKKWTVTGLDLIFIKVLLSFLKNFVTNQYIVVFFETILAVLYVVYSEPMFTIYPLIIWIFFNIYTRFESGLALNLKIWLLMVPSGINCLLSKKESKSGGISSMNQDFNFDASYSYKIFDLSSIGIGIMLLVILEMGILSWKKRSVEMTQFIANDKNNKDTGAGWTNQIFKSLVIFMINNSLYIIILNIYLIALDINVINLGLIVFFIKLIWTRAFTKKTIYCLFWYNQLCIMTRYVYNHFKFDWFSFQFSKMVGFEESNLFSPHIKQLLNFSLQIMLTIIIFTFRNEKLFMKFKEETRRAKIKSDFSHNSFEKTMINLKDFGEYLVFHSVPWLSYIAVYLALLIGSTNLVCIFELFYLAYLFIRHLRLAIVHPYGAFDKISPAWKVMLSLSAFMALGRYCLWFMMQDWFKANISWVKDLSVLIETRLSFIGLIPAQWSQAYFDLLPSFLAMYFASIIIERGNMVSFAIKNQQEIYDMVSNDEAADRVSAILGGAFQSLGEKKESEEEEKLRMQTVPTDSIRRTKRFTLFKSTSNLKNEPLIEESEVQEESVRNDETNLLKVKKMKALKVVFGYIQILRGIDKASLYFILKLLLCINFLLTVYLSTHFRRGLFMFFFLVLNLVYFWKSHEQFFEKAQNSDLDSKIIGRLKKFYRNFISKRGVMSENLSKFEDVLSNQIKVKLMAFTFVIRYNDLRVRSKFYRNFPVLLGLLFLLTYASKFLDSLQDFKVIQKWMRVVMMIFGVLIHSKNPFYDVYGYLILLIGTVAEAMVAKRLKQLMKATTTEAISDEIKRRSTNAMLKGEIVNKTDENAKVLEAFKVKCLIIAEDYLAPGKEKESFVVSVGPLSKIRPINQTIEHFESFEIDLNFLKDQHKMNNMDEEESDSESEGPSSPSKAHKSSIELSEQQKKVQEMQLSKLLYYFSNRTLYLNCKMYYGAIYLMLRGAYLVVICIADSLAAVISIFTLIYACYLWFSCIEEPKQSVRSLNKLLVFAIAMKYLVGCLNIQQYPGDPITTFEPSLVLIFLGNVDNKNYYFFDRLIGSSLDGYWLLLECLVFISVQAMILFYTIILSFNASVITQYIHEVRYMVKNFVRNPKVFSAAEVLPGESQTSRSQSTPMYMNFSKWTSPGTKFIEQFLKFGSVYLPVVTIIVLLAFSHNNASLVLLFIIILGVWLMYHLIFNWMYCLLEQRKTISRYLSWIIKMIWVYLILGCLTRSFEQRLKTLWPQFPSLGSSSFLITLCLTVFLSINDLWRSDDFERFYKEFLASNRLSQLLVPLCEAYEFNEDKLRKMINNLKSKEALEQRIKVMEKQLKIWHHKFSGKERANNDDLQNFNEWEKEIQELDKEEENLIMEMRYQENLVAKVGVLDRLVNYFYMGFMRQLNQYHTSPFLYLMTFVKSKNLDICEQVNFKIYDYISEDYKEYINILESIKAFYDDKEKVKLNINRLDRATTTKIVSQNVMSLIIDKITGEDNQKEFDKLQQASDIIARRLLVNKKSVKIDYTKISSTESSKTKMLFYDASVGGVPIRFYNVIDSDDEANQTDLNLLYRYSNRQKLLSILKSVPRYLLGNFQGVTLTVLIIYCLTDPYPLKLILLVYILLKGIVEENNLTRRFWSNLFYILAGLAILKLAVRSIFIMQEPDLSSSTPLTFQGYEVVPGGLIHPSQFIKGLTEFLLGKLSSTNWEMLSFLCVIFRILKAQMEGTFQQFLPEVENISEAFIRLKLNSQLDSLWVKDYKQKTKFIELLHKIVTNQQKKRKPKFDFSPECSLSQNEEILYVISEANLKERDRELQLQILGLIENKMQQTYFEYPDKFVTDDYWRFFSKYNRKTGADLYVFAAIVQILMLLFIFLFYKQMEEPVFSSSDALDSLKGERFSGWMTIFLFIQVGFIVYERRLFLLNTKQWNDWETFKKSKLDTTDPRFFLLKRVGKRLEGLSPPEKFKAVAKRVRFLIGLYNLEGEELFDLLTQANKKDDASSIEEHMKRADYLYNPLYKRLRFLMMLMFFFYGTMFVYFPIRGNLKTSGRIFCNSTFLPVMKTKCNHVLENIYIHGFFVLTTIYFLLCSLQIKYGESFLKNQKKKNRNWTKTEQITNLIVTKVPFVFEIKTSLDFAVTRSSLGLFEWFKFEDIYNTFFTAKYQQIASDMRRLGTARTIFEKILFGWLAMIIFLAIVLAPIFIFSNFNPDSVPNTLQSLDTSLGFKLDYSKFELYTNKNPREIRTLEQGEFTDLILPYTNKLNFKTTTIEKVSLYPFGDSTWSITSAMYKELERLLLDSLTNQKPAVLYLTMKMTQLSSKTTFYTVEKVIDPQLVLLMQEMLANCNGEKIIVQDFYFQFLKMNPTTGVEEFGPDNREQFTKSISLEAQCRETKAEAQGKTTQASSSVQFWTVGNYKKLTDEEKKKEKQKEKDKGNSDDNKGSSIDDGLFFYLILDNYSKSLSMFSSVVAMYTGFVLIIGNLIKGIFTGQTSKLWTTDVPKSEQIIRICEGVTAARIEGDTLREEVLYWELIDIMRSPEMVKLISQNYLEHKKNIEKVHEKTN